MAIVVISSPKTEETSLRLEANIPLYLHDKLNIALNMGNSQYSPTAYTLNHPSTIRNTVDKKRMFEIMKAYDIPCIQYIPLDTLTTRLKLLLYSILHKRSLVLRSNNTIKLCDSPKEILNKKWTYITIKETKKREYRILAFKDHIVKCYTKEPKNKKDFILKLDNTHFEPCEPLNEFKDIVTKLYKAFLLDISGIDILVNDQDQIKIIEINSGPGMSTSSCRAMLKQIIIFFDLEAPNPITKNKEVNKK